MRIAPALAILIVSSCSGGSTSQQPATIPSNQTPPTAGNEPPAAPAGLTNEVCAQRADDFGTVRLQADQVALRRGTGVKTFAELVATREAPIEVCMPQGERAWLKSVACVGAPQTPPSASEPAAPAPSPTFNRQGSVGAGGTCGSIIDLYVVNCPEKQYEVFMDMYMCPPGEGK
jgi:hypothetical protein